MSSDKEFPQEKPKLDSITVRGFKKISSASTMELSRVNFILGPNNAGKTSFFLAYELASWVQKHGRFTGMRQADVRRVLGVRPGSLNSRFSWMESLDFSVDAMTKHDDFIQKASYVGDEHAARMWEFEVDGYTLFIWVKDGGGLKWVVQPVGHREEAWLEEFDAEELRRKVAWEVASGLFAFGFELEEDAITKLCGVSGIDEPVDFGAEGWPSSFRGAIARKGERVLVMDGAGEFWLSDDHGRKFVEVDWEKELDVSLDRMSRTDLGKLVWLYRSLVRQQMVGQFQLAGEITVDRGSNVKEVVNEVGRAWQNAVRTEQVRRPYDFFVGKDGGWAFISGYDDWENHSDGAEVSSNLMSWLDLEAFNGREFVLGKELNEMVWYLTVVLDHRNENSDLDFSFFLPGVAEDVVIDWTNVEGKEQFEDWLNDQGMDERNYFNAMRLGGVNGLSSSYGDGELRLLFHWPDRLNREETGRAFFNLETKATRWECSEELKASVMHYIQEMLSNPQSVEAIRDVGNRHQPGSGDYDVRMRREFLKANQRSRIGGDLDMSDDGAALSHIWADASSMFALPFSFEVIRVSPDADPLKSTYHRAEEFPYPELWDVLESGTRDAQLRAKVKDGGRVIQACCWYLSIAGRFQLKWKPLNRRVEIVTSKFDADPGNYGLDELFSMRPSRMTEEEVEEVGFITDSRWQWEKRELDSAEVRRVMAEEEQGQVEDLGRGSRLVMKGLIGMFEASLRGGNSIVILEEPSAFLHPKMAAKFSEALRFAARKFDVQVVVETHNEYMVRQLVTKRLEGDDLYDVTVHYMSGKPSGLVRLAIDEGGRFNPPLPEGFLDKSQEMMREQTRIQLDQELGLD